MSNRRENLREAVLARIAAYFDEYGIDEMLFEHLHRLLVNEFPNLLSCHLWTQIQLEAKKLA
jgi:hypothetical protein